MSKNRKSSNGSAEPCYRDLRLHLLLSAVLFSGILFFVQGGLFGADESVVLEESQIFGKSPPGENGPGAASTDRPALSTAFPWDGEVETAFNIPEEILNELTQPDPAYLSGEAFESEESER